MVDVSCRFGTATFPVSVFVTIRTDVFFFFWGGEGYGLPRMHRLSNNFNTRSRRNKYFVKANRLGYKVGAAIPFRAALGYQN